MNTGTIRRKRLKELRRGNIKNVSLWEMISLRHAGKTDGMEGLPRQREDGSWTSAFMEREQGRFEEFCGQMWSLLQFEKEERYARLAELMDEIPKLKAAAMELDREMLAMEKDSSFHSRKRGEEALTEDQVQLRRERELVLLAEPLRGRMQELRHRTAADAEEFSQIIGSLEEDCNSIRMAIQRVREHSLQRLDIYWNTALKYHPMGEAMPPVPESVMTFRAEETYTALHRELMARAAAMQPDMTAILAGKEAA